MPWQRDEGEDESKEREEGKEWVSWVGHDKCRTEEGMILGVGQEREALYVEREGTPSSFLASVIKDPIVFQQGQCGVSISHRVRKNYVRIWTPIVLPIIRTEGEIETTLRIKNLRVTEEMLSPYMRNQNYRDPVSRHYNPHQYSYLENKAPRLETVIVTIGISAQCTV